MFPIFAEQMYPIFNIRVYGLLVNNNREVLVTEEFRFGNKMTKFPGGGLNFGEGTLDCIKREFREELDCEIEVLGHFYTTDYFQPSAFHTDHQLISIYYLIKNTATISTGGALEKKEGAQVFRWMKISSIKESAFTFPIDRKVAMMLKDQDL